jgi:hypothetical protein
VFLLGSKVHYSLVAEPSPGAMVREVRLNGRPIFPRRSNVGGATRLRLPVVESASALKEGEGLTIEVTDTAGKRSWCQITHSRRQAGAGATTTSTK